MPGRVLGGVSPGACVGAKCRSYGRRCCSNQAPPECHWGLLPLAPLTEAQGAPGPSQC